MKKLADEIISYIEYLKSEYRLEISLHISEKYIAECVYIEKLLSYNIHLNPYCTYVKKDRMSKCLSCQKAVYKKCKNIHTYIGECHAGVTQYLCSIMSDGEVAGFICASGYTGAKRAPNDNPIYEKNITKPYVPESMLSCIIPPLARMTELLLSNKLNLPEDNFRKIKAFVDKNHTYVSLDMICDKFHFSKSYISHIFKLNTGHTLKGYCNALKIADAKMLIENTGLSITDVAYSVGFNDLSYFISTFKKLTGTTPLEYKKNQGAYF